MQIARYNENGSIFATVTAGANEAFVQHLTDRGEHFVVVDLLPDDLWENWYVEEGEMSPRPDAGISIDKTSINADGQDAATIAGIPVPAIILVDGVERTVEDGQLEIVSETPATYTIEFTTWPYLPWRAEVTAQ